MGHSSIQVTMDIYGHIFPDVRENSVKMSDELFEKKWIQIKHHLIFQKDVIINLINLSNLFR